MENYDTFSREAVMKKYCSGKLSEEDFSALRSFTVYESQKHGKEKLSICLFELIKNLYSCLWVMSVANGKKVFLELTGYKGGCLLAPRLAEILILLILKNLLVFEGNLKVNLHPFGCIFYADFPIEKNKDLEDILFCLKGLYLKNTISGKTIIAIPFSPKKAELPIKSKIDYLLDSFSLFNLFICY